MSKIYSNDSFVLICLARALGTKTKPLKCKIEIAEINWKHFNAGFVLTL